MEANNAKAMREALVQIVALATQDQPRFAIISAAETALAKPRRNCDVGTAEEQAKRLYEWCSGRHCVNCQFKGDGLMNANSDGRRCPTKKARWKNEKQKQEEKTSP